MVERAFGLGGLRRGPAPARIVASHANRLTLDPLRSLSRGMLWVDASPSLHGMRLPKRQEKLKRRCG